MDLDPCEPGGLGPGSYTPSASAQNPADMSFSVTGSQFNVECSGPQLSVTSTENLNTWYPGPQTVEVAASDESGLQGPVSCTIAGQPVTIQQSQLPYALPVSQNGATSVSCTAENNVKYSTTTSLDGQIRIDSQVPSVAFSGSTPAPAWVSGPQTITVTGTEAQPLSGISSVSCQQDGGGWITADGPVESVHVTSDGVHTIACYATTAAGVKSATAIETVQVDSVAPTIGFSNGPNESSWATTAQSIDVTATKPAGSSGVAQVSCTLNQQTTTYTNTGNPDSETVKITVQPPGGDLSCKAQDNAGNWSTPQAWNFLIDNTTPTGAFLATDPSDPTQVAVQVADSVSGVKGVQIELQTADGWQPLATSLDPSTGVATATIPDSGSLADGTYQIQALVWSLAGNEATITKGPSASTGGGRPPAADRHPTARRTGTGSGRDLQPAPRRGAPVAHRPGPAGEARPALQRDRTVAQRAPSGCATASDRPSQGCWRRSTAALSPPGPSRSANSRQAGPHGRPGPSRPTAAGASPTRSPRAPHAPSRSPTPAPRSCAPPAAPPPSK